MNAEGTALLQLVRMGAEKEEFVEWTLPSDVEPPVVYGRDGFRYELVKARQGQGGLVQFFGRKLKRDGTRRAGGDFVAFRPGVPPESVEAIEEEDGEEASGA